MKTFGSLRATTKKLQRCLMWRCVTCPGRFRSKCFQVSKVHSYSCLVVIEWFSFIFRSIPTSKACNPLVIQYPACFFILITQGDRRTKISLKAGQLPTVEPDNVSKPGLFFEWCKTPIFSNKQKHIYKQLHTPMPITNHMFFVLCSHLNACIMGATCTL